MVSAGMPERKKARRRWYRLGPWRVQVRFACNLTLEQYVAQEGWKLATLERCPEHPEGGCGFARHGTYKRLHPVSCLIARYYCAVGHVTFSLLPDCLAAAMMGTLEQAEQSAVAVEQSEALEPIAYDVRPPEQEDPDGAVEPASVVQWMKRRHREVLAGLVVIAGLMPEWFAGCPVTLEGFGHRLGTDAVLVTLRQVAAEHLQRVPAPIGFEPRRPTIDVRARVGDWESARVAGARSPPDQEQSHEKRETLGPLSNHVGPQHADHRSGVRVAGQ